MADSASAAERKAVRLTVYVSEDTVFYKGVDTELRSPTQSNGKLTYQPGMTVKANGFNRDPSEDCAEGINFCRTLAEALQWAKSGTIVKVRPVGAIIDTGGKLRAAAVEVIEVANLYGANLYGANLTIVNLISTGANLYWGQPLPGPTSSGANLYRGQPLRGQPHQGQPLHGANLY